MVTDNENLIVRIEIWNLKNQETIERFRPWYINEYCQYERI
jgi:hypothetical protein